MILLAAEKLSMAYTEKKLLDNVSLFIDEKDKIGLIGINGTGKSTLLKILAGTQSPQSGTLSTASGVKIGYLSQNPTFNLTHTILQHVLSSTPVQEQAIREHEAKTILTKLGIVEFDKLISLLSGGQKKRVAIATTLMTPCDILILDEPTNHLDNKMVAWLEKMLKQYKGAILMVTHDRYFLDRVTNRIIEIDDANLYSYEANYTKFLELKAMREQSEIASERKRQSILRRELEWIQRGPRARGTKSKSRIESYYELSEQQAPPQDTKLELSSLTSRMGKKTLELIGITKSFEDRCLIKDFNYMVMRDARIGIVGNNGDGKSTLLNLIYGTIQPDCGNIVIGNTIKLGYFSQECETMDMNLRVIDYIKEGSATIETADGVLTASQMLERFLFPSHLQWTTISKLSGGERRRLFLLRILMDSPNILLLDEPTNDLDIQTLSILEEYLEYFNGAVITVSHDRYFLDRVVDRILQLNNGIITEYQGNYSDYTQIIEQQQKKETTLQKEASSSSEKRPKN
ncbi:MAG: ABC-F family ATP-binding cassette domain-containing protein, partial [Oscillospiraceae bacterium]